LSIVKQNIGSKMPEQCAVKDNEVRIRLVHEVDGGYVVNFTFEDDGRMCLHVPVKCEERPLIGWVYYMIEKADRCIHIYRERW